MPEKEEIIIDDQLAELKRTYHSIKTNASLDWGRIGSHERFSSRPEKINLFLKLAACIVFAGVAITVISALAFKLKYRGKQAEFPPSFAVTSLNMPNEFSMTSMPSPGDLSKIASMVHNQKSKMAAVPDFNKMPTFSMPTMVCKAEGRGRKTDK